MIDIELHIAHNNVIDFVFVKTQLPAVPRVGDHVWLDDGQEEELKRLASSDLSISKNYFPEWFYGRDIEEKRVEDLTKEDLLHISFEEAIIVKRVTFAYNNRIIVELGK